VPDSRSNLARSGFVGRYDQEVREMHVRMLAIELLRVGGGNASGKSRLGDFYDSQTGPDDRPRAGRTRVGY
jgi:hypothetical protein